MLCLTLLSSLSSLRDSAVDFIFISSPGGKMSVSIMHDVQQAEQSFPTRLCKGETRGNVVKITTLKTLAWVV